MFITTWLSKKHIMVFLLFFWNAFFCCFILCLATFFYGFICRAQAPRSTCLNPHFLHFDDPPLPNQNIITFPYDNRQDASGGPRTPFRPPGPPTFFYGFWVTFFYGFSLWGRSEPATKKTIEKPFYVFFAQLSKHIYIYI